TPGWSFRASYQLPGAVQGGGALGPNLTDHDTVRQFPAEGAQVTFVQQGSDFAKGYGVRGIGTGRMPGFGVQQRQVHGAAVVIPAFLTDPQIQAIVAYERSL